MSVCGRPDAQSRLARARSFLGRCILVLGSHGLRLLGLVGCQTMMIRVGGMAELGHFSFFVGIYTLFGLVCDLGVGPTAGKEIAHADDDHGRRQCAAAMVGMLGVPLILYTVLTLAGVTAFAACISQDLFLPGVLGGLIGVGFALQVPLRDLFTGKNDMVSFALLNALPFPAAAAFLQVFGLFRPLDLTTAMLVTGVTHTLTAVLLVRRATGGATASREETYRFQEARRRYGWGVSVGRIVGTGAFMLDVPLLGFFWPGSNLAAYAAIKTISQPLGVASNMVCRILFSSLVRAARIPWRLRLATLLVSTSAALVLAFAGYPALQLIYGIDAGPLRIALLAQCVAVMCHANYSLYDTFFHAKGRGRLLGFGGTCFGLLCVVSNLVLIPLRGAEGACLANALCNLSWLSFCLFHYRRHVRNDRSGPRATVDDISVPVVSGKGVAA